MGAKALHQISTLICLSHSKATCSQCRKCSLKLSQVEQFFLQAKVRISKRISIVTNSKFTGHLTRMIVT